MKCPKRGRRVVIAIASFIAILSQTDLTVWGGEGVRWYICRVRIDGWIDWVPKVGGQARSTCVVETDCEIMGRVQKSLKMDT